MPADETPLWNRLAARAREVGWDQLASSADPPRSPPPAHAAVSANTTKSVDGGPALTARAGSTLQVDPILQALVLHEVRELRRERWLWRLGWLALTASVLAAMSVDWQMLLPSSGCPLLTAQLVSEEFVP